MPQKKVSIEAVA